MRTADFDYKLPPASIAQQPAEPRDAARLLVDQGPGRATRHLHVRDLPSLVRPGDVVVVNDTKVIPARLPLRRTTGGACEVLLLEPHGDGWWEALVRPSARLRDGERLLSAEVEVGDVEVGEVEVVELGAAAGDGTRRVRLLVDESELAPVGRVPLPPYLTEELEDPDRYQTVYARSPGSVAAPTAGLHLTEALLDALGERGATVQRVELVVGLDTFKPVSVEDPADHRMHTERYTVPAATMRACEQATRVIAVGTTTTRALESAAARGALTGRTDLFIRRPYSWRVVDVLMTNFHLPRTTLLLMIDAFVGPRWRDLYEEALREGYRFLSFGDAMLLERA